MADATTTTKPPVQKFTGVSLRGPDGARLEVFVRRTPTSALAGCDHQTAPNGDGKRVHTRGATSQHPSWEEALKQKEKLIEQATKAGWLRPQGPIRGPRPDAFDANHLPAPMAKPAGGKK